MLVVEGPRLRSQVGCSQYISTLALSSFRSPNQRVFWEGNDCMWGCMWL